MTLEPVLHIFNTFNLVLSTDLLLCRVDSIRAHNINPESSASMDSSHYSHVYYPLANLHSVSLLNCCLLTSKATLLVDSFEENILNMLLIMETWQTLNNHTT